MKKPTLILIALVAGWFVAAEAVTELWYRAAESEAAPNPAWTFLWPDEAPAGTVPARGFREFEVVGEEVLHFDRARGASWQDNAGNRWIVTVLEWDPGAKVSAMDSRHNPIICLPSMGFELQQELGVTKVPTAVGDITFRGYEFRRPNGATPYVFSAVIRPLAIRDAEYRAGRLERRITQFEKAVNGNRQSPERVLLIAVEGPRSPEAADAALRQAFPDWLVAKS